ncbi:Thioredoxin C-1 [compost metagenome]
MLEELAVEVVGRAVVAKVNTDEYPELAFRLKVRGTPTFKVFIGGEEAVSAAGFRTREELLALLSAESK